MKEIKNYDIIKHLVLKDHILKPSQLKFVKLNNFIIDENTILQFSYIEHLNITNCNILLSKLQFFDFISSFKYFKYLERLEISNISFKQLEVAPSSTLKNQISHITLDIDCSYELLILILRQFNMYAIQSINILNQNIQITQILKYFPYITQYNGTKIKSPFQPDYIKLIKKLYKALQFQIKTNQQEISQIKKQRHQFQSQHIHTPEVINSNILLDSFTDFQVSKVDKEQQTINYEYIASESYFDGLGLFDNRFTGDSEKQTQSQYVGKNIGVQAEFSGNLELQMIALKVLHRQKLEISKITKYDFEGDDNIYAEIACLKQQNINLSSIDKKLLQSIQSIESSSVIIQSKTVIEEIDLLLSELQQ
ncbi:hypothetical protein SS50377_23341 [Spironucleus salmonicida]|uniref:Uncharacterized protein n=1 Tax=Spironucleus salmonicida TaxID=348837 RepID=V6LRM0_9EUKA|nr:hypothetical protein SS50377_23341 [Spironucleus salmonicida]|eukprot:EST47210.1 Hypothetical protein SS50377_12721 [Spironucleus salmonicida]